MRTFTDPDGETLDMRIERNEPFVSFAEKRRHEHLMAAKRRLEEERSSGCASPGDIAYWKSVIIDLGGEG